jgi:hypothetical protein
LAQRYINSLISIEALLRDALAQVFVREFFNRIGPKRKFNLIHHRSLRRGAAIVAGDFGTGC